MCVCHYPVGSGAGARLAGAGDARWVVWLSMMNYRWWLIHTLDAHKARFAVVNALIVVSFALRIVLMGYLLAFEIVPRTALYVDRKQVLTFVLCVLGHSVILALSMYWLKVLCSAGVRGLLVFRKPERARS